MEEIEEFISFVDKAVEFSNRILEISIQLEVADPLTGKLREWVNYVKKLKEERDRIPTRYFQQFKTYIDTITNSFSMYNDPFLEQIQRMDSSTRHSQKMNFGSILMCCNIIDQAIFNFDFFEKLNFFERNIVAVGANGSGKTTLADKLKHSLGNNGIVIVAQKILIIPTFSSISSNESTVQSLRDNRNQNKSTKIQCGPGGVMGPLNSIADEFSILLNRLLADRNAKINRVWVDAKTTDGKIDTNTVHTTLDRVIEIWNSLITHRNMNCIDGVNISISGKNIPPYPAYLMSDGEKVILYNIAQVLLAPRGGFIVVDEPEMYLHKSILCKLWNKLEQERGDCLFIYLTHDLEFASSRTNTQKVWIKSYTHPDNWDFEDVPPDSEIPEELLMRLLGSRKTILFCEGKKEKSLDQQIFEILFPHLTITPVETCKDVINYTKAYNCIPNTNKRAIGIVDRDFKEKDELDALQGNGIYSYSVAEIENLLLNEEFLRLFAIWMRDKDTKNVDQVKENVLNQLGKDKEKQCSYYLSAETNYHFSHSHMEKGDTIDKVKENYKRFIDAVNLQEWQTERDTIIDEVIEKKDYAKAILIYNNKGLFSSANKAFKIVNFQDRAIQFLKSEVKAQDILRKCFPDEIKAMNEN